MRLVVLAYQEVGYVCLESLLRAGADVRLVLTHEDDPREELADHSGLSPATECLGQRPGEQEQARELEQQEHDRVTRDGSQDRLHGEGPLRVDHPGAGTRQAVKIHPLRGRCKAGRRGGGRRTAGRRDREPVTAGGVAYA